MAPPLNKALLVCCWILLSGAVWAVGSNLDAVTNGSFEEGDQTWTPSPGRGVFRVSKKSARLGKQSLALRLGPSNRSGALTQDLKGLIAGRPYTLSFWLNKPSATSLTLSASVGGKAVHLKTSQRDASYGFEEYKGTFVAIGESANLALVFSTASNDSFEGFLDDVSVLPANSTSDDLALCPPEAPTPCYNQDNGQYICCKGTCGSATCQLDSNPPAAFSILYPVKAFLSQLLNKAASPSVEVQQTLEEKVQSALATARASRKLSSPARSLITTAQASAGSTSPAPAPGPKSPQTSFLPPPPTGYFWAVNQALTDEFNGSSLNASKWTNYHPTWTGRLPSQFDPSNVAVGNGTAQLRSTTNITNLNQVSDPDNDPWVSAAVIASRAPIASYGYYEARLKASLLEMTSSWWFQGSRTEIDVIETVGNPDDVTSGLMPISTHYQPEDTFFVASKEAMIPGNGLTKRFYYKLPRGVLTSGDFHTYGLYYKDAYTLSFYFDGNPVVTIQPPGPFNETMYMYFDTEVFVTSGLPTVSDLKDPTKNTFLVDWVHAFTLQRSKSSTLPVVKDSKG